MKYQIYNESMVKILKQFIAAFFIMIVLISPDIIYHFINDQYIFIFNPKEIGEFLVIGFVATSFRKYQYMLIFVTFFLFMSAVELAYFSYFGTLLNPYLIPAVFTQTGDVMESFIEYIGFLYHPFLVIFLLWIVLFIVLKSKFYAFYSKGFFTGNKGFFSVFIVFMFVGVPLKAYTIERPHLFYPKPKSYSAKNMYMACSLLLGRELPKKITGNGSAKFVPYEVRQTDLQAPTNHVIVVMGESLASQRMSLFGYKEFETTPLLSEMVKNDHFVARKAISAGVTTFISVPTFFALKREPENIDIFIRETGNLFKLAKSRGYKVYFISAQRKGVIDQYIGKLADVVLTREKILEQNPNKVYDDLLLNQLEQIDLSKPSFIVLHQENSHGPYEPHTPIEFRKYKYNNNDRHNMMVTTYANSVRFTDFVLYNMLKLLDQKSKLPFYWFMTSDHGQVLGEKGLYGHGMLEPEVATVPFLFYHKNGNQGLISKIKDTKDGISHYEIGKLVANALGYEVINKNENGENYINSFDLTGGAGFLTYKSNQSTTIPQ